MPPGLEWTTITLRNHGRWRVDQGLTDINRLSMVRHQRFAGDVQRLVKAACAPVANLAPVRHGRNARHRQRNNGVDLLVGFFLGDPPAAGILNHHGAERLLAQFIMGVQLKISSGEKVEKGLAHQCAIGLSLRELTDRQAGSLQRRDRPVQLIGVA